MVKKYHLIIGDHMEKKIERGSEEWQFFQDYYNFRQKFYEPEITEEWFEKLSKEADKMSKKYENTSIKEYVKSMILAHLEDIDRRYKREK